MGIVKMINFIYINISKISFSMFIFLLDPSFAYMDHGFSFDL